MKKKIIMASVIVAIILATIITVSVLENKKYQYELYQEFNTELEEGKIEKVIIEDAKVKFTKKENENLFYTDNPQNEGFKEKLLVNGVIVENSSVADTVGFIFDIVFYLFFFAVVIFAASKFLGFTNGKFKVVKHTNVKFEDIAGRALAEELKVNFIATRGADFQSAMMSMGAQKIKALFKKAKRHKPCIIFIDEFDSIGERRNYAGTGVDKENNRIVTTMLNEMDGFEPQDGILVIAATNSYESLDQALIRPGRFDLKYTISNPDSSTRIKLIELYTKSKKLSEEIEIEQLSDCFEHLSCSAIETILNVASMEASLEKHESISLDNIIVAARKTNCSINLRKIKKIK